MRRFPFTAKSGKLAPFWSFFRSFSCSFSVLLFCLFLGRFGVQFRTFLEPNIDQNGYLCFFEFYRFSLGFSIIFAFQMVLFSSYFGSFFASFFASIFGRFLVRLWGYFGRLLGGFWGAFGCPNRSFLVSIFR